MINGVVSSTEEGTPQGGPLSPLLSNIVLDELDKELEERGHKFVRYADDCNIYVKTKQAGERTMASIQRFIERKLRLKVNEKKSAVDRPWKRKFLGFSFTSSQRAKSSYRQRKPKANEEESTRNNLKKDALSNGISDSEIEPIFNRMVWIFCIS